MAFGESFLDLWVRERIAASPPHFSAFAGAPQLWGLGALSIPGCTCPGAPGLRVVALAPGGGVDEPESRALGECVHGADTPVGAGPRRVGAREPGFGPSRDVDSPIAPLPQKGGEPREEGETATRDSDWWFG